MGSKSDYLEGKWLDHVLGNTAYTAPSSVYMGLFTAMPTDAGGGTEVSGGSYARVTVTNNTTNWPNASGGSKQNGAQFTFPTATADWGTIVGWGIFDASTSGNLLYWGRLVGTEFAAVGATSDTITAPGSSFSNGDRVVVELASLGTLPTGLSVTQTPYYVVSASGDTFKVSLTLGGSAVDITADGVCLVGQDLSQAVLNGNTFAFATAGITITEN